MCENPLCIVVGNTYSQILTNFSEFCDKGSLATLLFSRQPLEFSKKISILKDIAAGMIHLEKENIIHR
jgi:serine/threonine protein kinase